MNLALTLERFTPFLREVAPHVFRPDGTIIGISTAELYSPPTYSAGPQYEAIDTSEPLLPTHTNILQQIIGVFLYYSLVIDNTMLPVVKSLTRLQSKPTQDVLELAIRLLQYAAAYPNHQLCYHGSDMILTGESDATLHSLPNGQSNSAHFYYFTDNWPQYIYDAIDQLPKTEAATADATISAMVEACQNKANHPIVVDVKAIDTVVTAASHAEYAALFNAGQSNCRLRTIATALGHEQPPTILANDNIVANGASHGRIKEKKTKTLALRYHWIKDQVKQGNILPVWRPGHTNGADFFTKPQPAHKFNRLKHRFVQHPPNASNTSLPPRMRKNAMHQQQQSARGKRVY